MAQCWQLAPTRIGSNLDYTKRLQENLPNLLSVLGVKRFFDAPCGDFGWMSELRLPLTLDYLGGDIVPSLVHNLREKYSTPQRRFIEFDVVNDKFPDVDLWLCRDCFIHLSNTD